MENIHKFMDMVDYQEDTIVSRIIIKKDTGNVTLFAFDKGQDLSEHTVPFDALVHVFDGKAEITIDGSPHLLNAGEMVVMPANKPHSVKAIEKFKMCLTMIKEIPGEVKSVDTKDKWYFKTHWLIIGFLSIGPFILPLLWLNPRFNRRNKIIVSIIALVCSYFLGILVINSIKSIITYYQQMFQLLQG